MCIIEKIGYPFKKSVCDKENRFMFDEYFRELEPAKRKEILDGLTPEAGEEESLEQIRSLFSLRYTPNKKLGYTDEFVGALMSLRLIAYNPSGKRRDARLAGEAMHTLCLDRTDEFSPDILYSELCQLMAFYISSCLDDSQYRSVVFGLGRMRDERLVDKIQKDLNRIWEEVTKYSVHGRNAQILKNAMDDTMDKLMNREKTSWF